MIVAGGGGGGGGGEGGMKEGFADLKGLRPVVCGCTHKHIHSFKPVYQLGAMFICHFWQL